METRWVWQDAWVLASIATVASNRNDGACLADVVAAGDMINHAIFLESELNQGVGRLAGSGLVTDENGKFHLTEKATVLLTGSGRSISAIQRLLSSVLMVAEDWQLEQGVLEAALKDYKRRIAQL